MINGNLVKELVNVLGVSKLNAIAFNELLHKKYIVRCIECTEEQARWQSRFDPKDMFTQDNEVTEFGDALDEQGNLVDLPTPMTEQEKLEDVLNTSESMGDAGEDHDDPNTDENNAAGELNEFLSQGVEGNGPDGEKYSDQESAQN